MRLLNFLAQVFINTFGITQPAPQQQRKVAILLGGFILAVMLIVFLITGFLLFELHLSR